MGKKMVIMGVAVGCVCAFMPVEALAQTASAFASNEFLDQSKTIQAFLFGPAMRIAGVLGGAYGLMQSILGSSLKPLIVYGGIGLAVNLIPKFIDGVFNVSGYLIP